MRLRRWGVPPRGEWMGVLSDGTEVVVAEVGGKPCPLGIEKAAAIAQARSCLEAQARRLLEPLGQQGGEWRLLAMDFGREAQRHDCEFLMCFAFQAAQSGLAATCPYVEVGFALPVRCSTSPMFVLTIRTMAGLGG